MARVSRKGSSARAAHPVLFRRYKTALYVRLSVEDIRKRISDSIGTQRAMLLDFLQASPDLELYDVYEDVNYTGTNFNRPGFTRMMEDIQAGVVDCVVVKDLSRFGRSFEEMGHFLERVFPFLQVRFISINDRYDSLTASLDESSLIVPIKNLMNEVYARDISKKTRSGKRAKQQRGEFCGSFAPYGYTKVGSSFVVDEETAPVVKQIYQWIIDGMSDTTIAQKLNGMEVLPPSRYRFEKGITKAKKHEDTKFWYKSAIKRISEYLVYTGVMVSGKFQSDFLRGGGTVAKNRDEWIITEDAHPAIIDQETYEAVQTIREARKQNHKTEAPNAGQGNIFKGLIFCGDCGSHMTRRQQRKKHTFFCNVHLEVDKNACTYKPIREADMQTALYAYISREISLCVDMSRIIDDLKKRTSFQRQRYTFDRRIEALQAKLIQNRRFRGSLREDHKDGILTEQDYIMLKADYDEEKDSLQKELDALLAEKLRQENTLSPENKWVAEFRRFESERQLSAQMVSALVERIEVYEGARIEVKLHYRDEFEALRACINVFETEAKAANG